MQNDPELNGKYLGTITKDFVKVSDVLKEAAYQLKARKISEFPIFPIAKVDLPIGQALLSKEQKKTDWNYNFSFLDEFVQRGFVDADKEGEFKNSFKNPEDFCCLLPHERYVTFYLN